MDRNPFAELDVSSLATPCYLCDTGLLRRNLEILAAIQQRTGGKILLALKGFAMFSLFPIIREYLCGTTASSLHEARLGREEFGGEVHVYAPAYKDEELDELLGYADHIVFNSFSQWHRFRERVPAAGKAVECGLRLNPEYSEIKYDQYNPCVRYSRLGIPLAAFKEHELEGISGLHFHTHCEQQADVLERTLAVFEQKFGRFLSGMQWLNLGGGHHITRPGYDVDRLCRLILQIKNRYGVAVYLEPGEAIALHTGVLVASVLDIIHNEMDIAILDTSAAAHMPDVLDMPYRPEVIGAGLPGELPHTYRLGGLTCLAGDIIGDYSFARPLTVGDKLIFLDMAHYSMVKNNTFNGVQLPSIVIRDGETGGFRVVRTFGYQDYRNRLS